MYRATSAAGTPESGEWAGSGEKTPGTKSEHGGGVCSDLQKVLPASVVMCGPYVRYSAAARLQPDAAFSIYIKVW